MSAVDEADQSVSYLGELRRNIRPLAAASLGSGAGLMLMSYMTTIFGPYLVKEFGWSRSQFALIGLAMVSTLVALPFIGKLTDHFGVRRAALVGALGLPLCLLGYSLMKGDFNVYFLLSCTILTVGSFTSPVVYTRLIAADFKKARGLALTIVTISPAILGAIAAPIVTNIIDHWGWRAGYRAVAVFMLVCGLAAIALVPPNDAAAMEATKVKKRPARGDFSLILNSPTFWIICGAMVFCSFQTPLHASQMGMMLRDNNLGSVAAAAMISVYGVGTIFGRLVCGLALDKFPAPVVAAISMFLPAIGYAVLATQVDTTTAIAVAMFLVGLAVGAEGDLQSYLVARHFDLRIFSTTLSLVYCGVFAAGAAGSLLISLTLKQTNSFDYYLAAMAVMVTIGAVLFLFLGKASGLTKIGEQRNLPDDGASELFVGRSA